MEARAKKIIGLGILGNLGAIMTVIGVLGGLGIIDPLVMAIIEIIVAPNLAMLYALVRFYFGITEAEAPTPDPVVPTPTPPV